MVRTGSTPSPCKYSKGQKTRGVKDRDRIEKPGEENQTVQAPLQPPPKAPAERRMRGVKVLLRKIPLQVWEEGRRHLRRPEVGPEANQTRQKEAGHEGRPGHPANNPEEGREQEDSPAPRTLAEACPSQPRLLHALDTR